jgi:hypothetical protein
MGKMKQEFTKGLLATIKKIGHKEIWDKLGGDRRDTWVAINAVRSAQDHLQGSGNEIRGTRQEHKSQEAEDVARPLEDKPGGTRAAQCYLQIGMSEPPSKREKQKYPSTDW